MKPLLLLCAALLAVPAARADIVWRGDFETGNRSQWTRTQMMSGDRLEVVEDPVTQGRYALKATVRKGDDPINSSGNRNELVRMTWEPEGSEYVYRWQTMFDRTFPSVKTWQLFAQWHQADDYGGSPPVEFYVYGEEIRLNIGGNPGTIVWRAPLVRGKWIDFVFRVRWSPDPKVGFVELYVDGKMVLPQRYIATQYKGQKNYLKAGLYRNDTINEVGIVYHDGWTMAQSLADFLPPPTPAPDTGTPPVDAGTPPPVADAGTEKPEPVDAGAPVADAGGGTVGGQGQVDAGVDAGPPVCVPPETPESSGRGCAAAGSVPVALGALLVLVLWRRRR